MSVRYRGGSAYASRGHVPRDRAYTSLGGRARSATRARELDGGESKHAINNNNNNRRREGGGREGGREGGGREGGRKEGRKEEEEEEEEGGRGRRERGRLLNHCRKHPKRNNWHAFCRWSSA